MTHAAGSPRQPPPRAFGDEDERVERGERHGDRDAAFKTLVSCLEVHEKEPDDGGLGHGEADERDEERRLGDARVDDADLEEREGASTPKIDQVFFAIDVRGHGGSHCVARGNEVDERKDEDPDQIDEVPEEADELDWAVLAAVEFAEQRADEDDR